MIVPAARLLGLYRRFLGNGSFFIKPPLYKKMLRHIASGEPMKFKKHEYNGLLRAAKEHDKIRRMSDTASLKTSFVPNRYTKTAGPMHISQFKRVPMLDIDLPDAMSHRAAQIRFKDFKSWKKNLDRYLNTKQGSKSVFDIYSSPAGIRAFDLGVRTSPIRYYNRANALGSDPWYQKFSMMRGSFASRISPKPGREGDYVAQKFLTGYGPGKVNELSQMQVAKYHDNLIKKIKVAEPKDMDELTSLLDVAYSKSV